MLIILNILYIKLEAKKTYARFARFCNLCIYKIKKQIKIIFLKKLNLLPTIIYNISNLIFCVKGLSYRSNRSNYFNVF
tara:strand:- start:27 stop:260 length:234 start_codon:yes stop_codon:yes gene_type:complete